MSTQIKCGPSGGVGGYDFADTFLPTERKITEIIVWYEDTVEAIQVGWSDGSNSGKHGRGTHNHTLIPLTKNEYLVGISGRYGSRVDTITFITTDQTHGPYGGEGGEVEFSYNVDPIYPQAQLVGFLGRAGDIIDAIGCIFSVEKRP